MVVRIRPDDNSIQHINNSNSNENIRTVFPLLPPTTVQVLSFLLLTISLSSHFHSLSNSM